MLGTVLIILLILFLIGGLPNFGYHRYGYYTSGLGGILLIIVLVLLLTGRLG